MTKHKPDLFKQGPREDWLSQTTSVVSPLVASLIHEIKSVAAIYFLITFSDGVSASM